MRRLIGLTLPLAALSGCSMKAQEPIAEMPKFGSSAKYANTSGFVEGRWRYVLDESTPRYHMPEYGKALTSTVSEELAMTADGKAEFLFQGHKAHGRWSANGNGIDLTFEDVDGVAATEVQAKEQKWLDGSPWYRRLHELDYTRGVTLDLAGHVKRL